MVSLDFSPEFRPVFDALMAAVPTLKVTSGRRTLTSQLEAMLINEAASPGYIQKTYIQTPLIKWLVRKVQQDKNVKMTPARRALGYTFDIEDKFSHADQQRLSRHITGDAIDLFPDPAVEARIRSVLASLPVATKFLAKEGGMARFHIQLI